MKEKETAVPFRLPNHWLKFIRELKPVVGFSQQQMLEDAVVLWAGKHDPVAQARRKMVFKALETGKVKRPFEMPLTPFSDSAVLV